MQVPADATQSSLGSIATPLFYLRCRLLTASYDATPLLLRVAANSVLAEQAVPASGTLTIAANAVITGPAPLPGSQICFDCSVDAKGVISSITFLPAGAAAHPNANVIAYKAPTPNASGSLTLETVLISDQSLPGAPIERNSLSISHSIGNLAAMDNP